jgi:lactate dehydrogenase-like 2-hydroxyacid dehydrogenase
MDKGSAFRVLWLDPPEQDQLASMQKLARPLGLDLVAPLATEPDKVAALLATAEVLVVQHRPASSVLIAGAPRLRLIQKYGGRRDGIDLSAARARGIAVAVMPLAGTIAVAEHAMALVLACAKKIVLAHQLTVTGAYRELGVEPKVTTERSHGFQWMKIAGVEELYGLTMGIYGFGEIGTEVAQRARAFGMRVLYTKRSRLPTDLEIELGVAYADKDALLRESDFVVLTCPLTPETEKAIGACELALMKPSAYLVNVSRGGVIDELALCAALQERRIAGAGLDVFVEEPVPFDHPYLALYRSGGNITLTPHIAGGKGGARQRQMVAVLDNVARFVRGEPLLHRIA